MRPGFLIQALLATLLGLSAASNKNPAAKEKHPAQALDELIIGRHMTSSPISTFTSILAARASPQPDEASNAKNTRSDDDESGEGSMPIGDGQWKSARAEHVHRHHMKRTHGHARREVDRRGTSMFCVSLALSLLS